MKCKPRHSVNLNTCFNMQTPFLCLHWRSRAFEGGRDLYALYEGTKLLKLSGGLQISCCGYGPLVACYRMGEILNYIGGEIWC